jgi:hypothetical protein
MMKIKGGPQGARITGVRPEVLFALVLVSQVFAVRKLDLVVTSFCEGKHSKGSFHYLGLAADIRLNDIPQALHTTLQTEILAILGDDFDFLLENSGTTLVHFHLELHPKSGSNL